MMTYSLFALINEGYNQCQYNSTGLDCPLSLCHKVTFNPASGAEGTQNPACGIVARRAKPQTHLYETTLKRLNVEHRTPNFQRPIMRALRFIYFKPANRVEDVIKRPQNTHPKSFEGWIRFVRSFYKIGRIHSFDVRC